MRRWALIESDTVTTVVEQEDSPIASGQWQEVNTSVSPGDAWNSGAPARQKRWEISVDAFWDRFTFAERVNLDLAMQHDPASTNAAKKAAAKYRIRVADVNHGISVRLHKNSTDTLVRDMETDGIIGVGRADQILLTEAAPGEAVTALR